MLFSVNVLFVLGVSEREEAIDVLHPATELFASLKNMMSQIEACLKQV